MIQCGVMHLYSYTSTPLLCTFREAWTVS